MASLEAKAETMCDEIDRLKRASSDQQHSHLQEMVQLKARLHEMTLIMNQRENETSSLM